MTSMMTPDLNLWPQAGVSQTLPDTKSPHMYKTAAFLITDPILGHSDIEPENKHFYIAEVERFPP